jgi:hypothetical protein
MFNATPRRLLIPGACILAFTMLAGCPTDEEEPETVEVGGIVSGLNGTLVLAAEGDKSDSIAISASGAFKFNEEFDLDESDLDVFVFKQPLGQTCTVGGSSQNGVTVSCVDDPYTVSGTVTGLANGATVGVQLNLAGNLAVGNGTFSFVKPLPAGSAYAVSLIVGSQPAYTCTLASGAGVINAPVTNVAITCTPRAATSTLGGTVSGITGTVALYNSATAETITLNQNGSFTFPQQPVAMGAEYFVTVTSQPAGQICSVSNANGFIAPNSATVLGVSCTLGSQTRLIGGVISGLKAPIKLGIQLNNRLLDVNPSGAAEVTYQFPVPLGAGTKYQVSVRTQPAGQTCIIPHYAGAVVEGIDTAVSVVCVDNVTDPITGTYYAYDGEGAITFYAGGIYVNAQIDADADCGASFGNGVEMGAYRYNASTGAISLITNVLDTNGSRCGLWRGNTSVINNGTLSKTGAAQATVLVITPSPGEVPVPFIPVPSVANRPIGAFAVSGGPSVMIFTDDGQYLGANANNDPVGNAPAGVEYGCFNFALAPANTLTPLATGCDEALDTDGAAGLSSYANVALPYTAGPNQLTLNNNQIVGARLLPN